MRSRTPCGDKDIRGTYREVHDEEFRHDFSKVVIRDRDNDDLVGRLRGLAAMTLREPGEISEPTKPLPSCEPN